MNVVPKPQAYWDTRAAGNFALGGAGSGLIAFAGVAASLGIAAHAATLAGATLVAAGLVLVWLEIGRPARFLNVFRNPRTSWMSREAWAAVLLLPLAAAGAAGSAPATIAAALVAVVFLYSQARILESARGIPAWRQAATVPLVVVAGATEGCALFVILSAIGVVASGPWPAAGYAAVATVLVARCVAWRSWMVRLETHAPGGSSAVMKRFEPAFLAGGHVLPAVVAGVAWFVPSISDDLLVLAGLLVVLSGWALKLRLVVSAGHTQGFALAHAPARGGGLAGPGARPGWNPASGGDRPAPERIEQPEADNAIVRRERT